MESEKCKVCRSLGVCVFKQRCATLERRPNPPGQHGQQVRHKLTAYGEQLKETKKLRMYYGISARQFVNYYQKAQRSREQINVALIRQLEMRLDNIVYRLGFAGSLRAARQMVVHRHFLVNGKSINKPSVRLCPGDFLQLRPQSQKIERYREWFQFYAQDLPYLRRNTEPFSGQVVRVPERSEIPILVNDHLVVEFMSR